MKEAYSTIQIRTIEQWRRKRRQGLVWRKIDVPNIVKIHKCTTFIFEPPENVYSIEFVDIYSCSGVQRGITAAREFIHWKKLGGAVCCVESVKNMELHYISYINYGITFKR
jgi:hypothetical protein